ncbi:MAG: sugar-binding transcriptional regulator [Trueperaceae bacterium]|nr:sugar-binding transcriptional regulator [Trueperaceae bacterium]
MDDKHQYLLAKVADFYYNQEKTQGAIGKELGLSRVKIYRLLKEARDKGVVRITINWPIKTNSELEHRLKERFGLTDALVLANSQGLSALAELAAQYLEQNLKPRSTLAICLGRTTHAVIEALHPDYQAHIRVVQATGGMSSSLQQYDSSSLARQLAEKLGGEAIYLPSPAIADNREAAQVIMQQSEVQRVLESARKADYALVGIGNLDPKSSNFVKAGFLQEPDVLALGEAGAVGDMAWHIFDAGGNLHPSSFNEQIIGISLEDLKQIPVTIAVAQGKEKAQAILGALNTRALRVLCSDEETTLTLLAL